MVVTGGGEGAKNCCFNGFNVSELSDKQNSGDLFLTMWTYFTPLIVHLNMVKMVTAF